MIAVLQRVSKGDVTIYGKTCGAIRQGLVILLGVMKDDTEKDVIFLTEKILGFRIFYDKGKKMNLSIKDLYEQFINHLREMGTHVDSGKFGATMSVSLVNEGPVTFVLDSKN